MTILTNAHTHLELGWLADYCPDENGQDFLTWIGGLIERRSARAQAGELRNLEIQSVEKGIQTLTDAGTTHVGDITLGGMSVEPLLDSGLAGVVYVESIGAHSRDAQERFDHVHQIVERWRPHERNGMRVGVTVHTTYTVSPRLWELSLEYVRKEALPLCIHIAENRDEVDFMQRNTGAMTEEPWRGMRDFEPPMKSAFKYLEDMGVLELKPLLVHAVHVDDADIALIKQYDCAVAHCPRSNVRLRCGRMPLEKYLAAGVKVYLGTDSLSSCPSLDIRDELQAAVKMHEGIVDAATIEGLTQQAL